VFEPGNGKVSTGSTRERKKEGIFLAGEPNTPYFVPTHVQELSACRYGIQTAKPPAKIPEWSHKN
jgi:hypothetical protein